MNKFHHVVERRAGKENLVYAFASHHCGVVVRDGAAAAAENLDVVRAFFAQKIDNVREKFDVPAVVTRDADRPHVFLDRGADDVANRAMIAEINHLDPVPDELEVDRIDRAVVPVANRDSGQNSDR